MQLTVSTVPGTTLGLVRFPLGESAFLYDTPGLISRAQISTLLTPEEIKAILPTKRIKPVVYRISPGTTIFIGGYVVSRILQALLVSLSLTTIQLQFGEV